MGALISEDDPRPALVGHSRDEFMRRLWIDPRFRVPDTDPRGPHYPTQVLAVVEDMMTGIKHPPFVEMVHWWPASKAWTTTHSTPHPVVEDEPKDFPCKVRWWMPLPPIPW